MKLNLQNLNPFKNKDQRRDTDGKFTAGGGGLKAVKKFNWGRAAPVVAIVGLVGGYVVYQSFAGTALYRYQYSTYQCPNFNKDDTAKNTNESCVNASAEGLVYRYYKAVFGRDPDNSGYKFWTQQLAGDREKPSRVAAKMLASSENNFGNLSNEDYVAKLYQNVLKRNGDPSGMAYWTKKLDDKSWTRDRVLSQFAATAKITAADAQIQMGKPTNEQFVQQLYTSLFERQADSGGLAYWKGQLDGNKLSRSDVIARFAVDEASMKALGNDFATFLTTAPQLTITQTAKKKQDERLYISAVRVNDAKRTYDSIKSLTDNGRKNRDTAKSIASKATPSRSDLSAIASNQKTVEGYKKKVPDVQRKLAIWTDKNKSLYAEAKTVSDWSPDLSSDAIKKNYDTVAFYLALANNMNKDLDYLIKDIAKQYKVAEGKYEAEQRRKAEEAARKAAEAAAPGTGTKIIEKTGGKGKVLSDCRNDSKTYGIGGGDRTEEWVATSIVNDRCKYTVTYSVTCHRGYERFFATDGIPGCKFIERPDGGVTSCSTTLIYQKRTTTKYFPNIFGTTVYQTRYTYYKESKGKCISANNWSGWKDVSKATYDSTKGKVV